MPKTIICSVGTSAAKAICPAARLGAWVNDQGGPGAAAAKILATFADQLPQGPALRDKLSAEIHSLASIGLTAADRVLLLASATADGYACALAVAAYLERHWPGVSVSAEQIAGLQVHDAAQFRREGVVHFTRRCLEEVNNYGAQNVTLNPTGGFKALVPYTVLIGMLKRVPCRYIFEQSNTLLELPPLPVDIDRGPFEAYRELFEKIEREAAVQATEWEAVVPYEERRVLEPLVEREGNWITLSGVGLLFLDEVRTPSECVPFLSQQAWDDCLNNLARLSNCDPFRFLRRVGNSGQAFRQAEHINQGNGLRWLKPGNTTDRYLVSLEGWRLLVWRAIREDQEGANYPQRVVVDPVRDRSRYAPFTRMEFVS